MSDIFAQHMESMSAREKMLDEQGIKIFRLSTTERQEFKECRRRWDYGSLSRQGIEANRPAIALWFGTGIHHALEMYYSNTPAELSEEEKTSYIEGETEPWFNIVRHWDQWCKKELARLEESQKGLWDEQLQELQASVDLGREMLKGYVSWSEVADEQVGTGFKKVLYTEREFAVPIPGEDGEPYHFTDGSGQEWEMWLVGRLDMVVEDEDGRIWVLDHKTSKDRLDPEILTLDDQMTMYLWAAQQILKQPIEGCYYNVLRKKLPVVPEVLKSGKGLSKAKTIDTTYDVYLQAILDNGFDPADYDEILDILANKKTGFFEREKVHRNQHEIAMAGRMLLLEAIDMLNDPYIYPNPCRDCKWKCDYLTLCLATNRNDDVEYLKQTLYRKREYEDGSVYNRETTNGGNE